MAGVEPGKLAKLEAKLTGAEPRRVVTPFEGFGHQWGKVITQSISRLETGDKVDLVDARRRFLEGVAGINFSAAEREKVAGIIEAAGGTWNKEVLETLERMCEEAFPGLNREERMKIRDEEARSRGG